jgi:diguanylate cyclase
MQTSPSTIAREALRQLASRRLPPTPDNYTRAYQEIAAPGARVDVHAAVAMLREIAEDAIGGTTPNADAIALKSHIDALEWSQAKSALKRLCDSHPRDPSHSWAKVVRDLITQWEARTPGLTQARKRESLEHVLSAFEASPDALYTRLRGLARAWGDAAASSRPESPEIEVRGTLPAVAPAPEPQPITGGRVIDATPALVAPEPSRPAKAPVGVIDVEPLPELDYEAAKTWRELVAQALTYGVVERLGYSADLIEQAKNLASEALAADDADKLAALCAHLKSFWVTLELKCDDQLEVQQGLQRLLKLLTLNLTELIGNDSWLHGQLKAVAALAEGPVDQQSIVTLERKLRDITLKQGILKHSLDQAKDALKQMVSTFVDRLSTLADGTSEYHDRLSGYAKRIEIADDLSQLSDVIGEVMNDTRGVQSDLVRTREELIENRQRVDTYQAQVIKLESEMASLSDRLHEDQLTSLLNRRGLARAFESEIARADRHQRPLCVAMLDVDDFKRLNDRLGHQAGDLALVHLARTVRKSIRPTDIISRFGGEEFLILLPETALAEAVSVMKRVQRSLTKRIFLHDHERILITFSAGVSQRQDGENEESLVARADRALYLAKQAGKNRVVGE